MREKKTEEGYMLFDQRRIRSLMMKDTWFREIITNKCSKSRRDEDEEEEEKSEIDQSRENEKERERRKTRVMHLLILSL